MAKCICIKDTQVRVGDKILTLKKGTVKAFKQCPTNFRILEEEPIDFSSAGEEELLEREDYKLKDLKSYIFDTYEVDVPKNAGKEKTVAALMDARFRAVSGTEAIDVEGVI